MKLKKKYVILISLCLSWLYSFGFSNPVAEIYNEGYPSWTEEIKWDNIINMKTDSRLSSIEGEWSKFEKGIELLGEEGGILYYPAGVYRFDDLPDGDDGTKSDGEGLMLRSGVIIMGEKPSNIQLASDTDGGLIELETVFEFPLYEHIVVGAGDKEIVKKLPGMWNFVGMKPRSGEELKDINNIGICFINFINATVFWGPQYIWKENIIYSNGWFNERIPDGTHYNDVNTGYKNVSMTDPLNGNQTNGAEFVGCGSGRLILCCRFDNGFKMNPGGYSGTYKDGESNAQSHLFTFRAFEPFGTRISISASNVFIASASLTKPTNAFLYKDYLKMAAKDPVMDSDNQDKMLKVPLLFDPGNNGGISVGRNVGMVNVAQRHMLDENSCNYLPNIVVRDCYVYNHGSTGYSISGRWVRILNNVNDRDFSKGGAIPRTSSPEHIEHIGDAFKVYGLDDVISYRILKGRNTLDVPGAPGHYIARRNTLEGVAQNDDNLSRAFDIGGQNVWVDGNRFWATGSWPGNDGEGILGQRWGEYEAFSWSVTNNEAPLVSDPWPKSGYMAAWDMHVLGGLWYNNKGGHPEWVAGVWATAGEDKVEEVAVINNICTDGNTRADKLDITLKSTSGPVWNTNSAPSSGIKAPSDVKAIYDAKKGYVEISWDPDYSIEGKKITDNNNEVGYRIERRNEDSSEWTIVAYRPMQTGYKLLSGVNRTFNGKNSWTLEEMDLNPPLWRDYDKIDGIAEYRVIALGKDENLDMAQNEPPIKVMFSASTSISVNPSDEIEISYSAEDNDIKVSTIANSIKVLGIGGNLITQITNSDKLNISSLEPGLYIVNVQKNNLSKSIKILKN